MDSTNFGSLDDQQNFMKIKREDPEKAQAIIDEQKIEAEKINERMEKDKLSYQYNKISHEYALATIKDANKRFVQYPGALSLLGDIENKDILDMGCGNGTITRMMALKGAKVDAYDISEEQIKQAKEQERADPLGINYYSGIQPDLTSEKKYDIVTSIMVLPCAVDKKELDKMFQSAHSALKADGKMTGLTINPDFKRYDENVCNRRFKKNKDGNVDIDFLNNDGVVDFSITDTFFTRAEIENSAKKAGFTIFTWNNLEVDPVGIKEMGKDFWKGVDEDPLYIGFETYNLKR